MFMRGDRRVLMSLLGAALLTFVLTRPADASKEGGLSLCGVTLDSPGMEGSGPVHVELKRSDEGIEKLLVTAFGRTETAPAQLLQSVKEKQWLSGVTLSWERGYRSTGGKTVYVLLTEGASWRIVVVAAIAFSEDGKFRVFKNLSHEEVAKAEMLPYP
jgi:hypothetical protein